MRQQMRAFAIWPLSTRAPPEEVDTVDNDVDFLDNLSGRWLLTGMMGEVELRQEVASRWVLGRKFMQMDFHSIAQRENPTASYEAVYHVGYNRQEGLYVLHLLDTTEIPIECTVGLGRRVGQSIPFRFAYDDAIFTNTFTWQPEQSMWRFLQMFESQGATKTFATKEMTRIAG